MANTLWITEYAGYEVGGLPCAVEPALANQTTTPAATHSESSAFGSGTHLVRLVCNSSCSIKFGQSPVATASSTFLPSGVPEYFVVQPGHALSCITNS